MCQRYTLYTDLKGIEEHFESEARDSVNGNYQPNYNVAPGHSMPVVLMSKTREKKIDILDWGLILRESSDDSGALENFNVPDEELEKKPEYKKSFQRKRCIIPANGFYEWKQLESVQLPFYIRLLNQELFGMAGLFDKWTSPEGEDRYTFTIITTQANALVQPLHTRMPAILQPEHYEYWLDPMNSDFEELHEILQPYPTEQMATYRVTNKVNSLDNNDAELTQPVMQK